MNLRSYFANHFYEYLKQSSSFIVIIVIVDLLPLLAVLWSGWSAMEAMYLYTLETIIILWISLRKMWRSKYMLALFVDQTQNIADKVSERTQSMNLGFKIPSFSWLKTGTRGILYFVFTFLWVPLILLQLMIVSAVSGNGFKLWGFLDFNAGSLNLGLFSVNLMLVFLILLFLEHTFAYRNKFIKEKEYENTGLLNEGLSFTLRVFIQQFIIIGLFAVIGWMHIDSFSMIIVILIKTAIDIVSYIFNRIWGGLKDKKEANENNITSAPIT